MKTDFDCIVVGGGHAGVEASHIVSRAGYRTLLLTLNLDEIAQMSCNPAIGGIAKGHIVREIDALGGLMGKIIDHTGIHFKMLNRSKGPAMWSPRAQADKTRYKNYAKYLLECAPNLHIMQDNATEIIAGDKMEMVRGVKTERGNEYLAPYVIVTTGTFLRGLIHIGDFSSGGGRFGSRSADFLSPSLLSLGIKTSRLKTGTPPRVHSDSIDYSRLEIQEPDEEAQLFSYENEYRGAVPSLPQIPCHIAYTGDQTKEVVSTNLNRSALYGGKIQSVGPRYCPSIEDKIVRFADKERHQIFLEPEGLDTKEVYLNGISTSLPEDVQWKMVQSMAGLEHAQIMRPGYAIEYDFAPPTQLHPWLETKTVRGLFFAGQINGTTGYEEAGGQGLVAGLNVIHKIQKREPLVLARDEAYLGVLIDDLVTKGVEEPYRMFTSRAEYRLRLRQDNADERLMKYPQALGINTELFGQMSERYARFEEAKKKVASIRVDGQIQELLLRHDIRVEKGTSMENIFRRPQATSSVCLELFTAIGDRINGGNNQDGEGASLSQYTSAEKTRIVMDMKYQGYLKREHSKTKRRQESLRKKIPANIDYDGIYGLKTEARQKLKKIQPADLGQAARISGVDPTDIDILLLHLDSKSQVTQNGTKRSKTENKPDGTR